MSPESQRPSPERSPTAVVFRPHPRPMIITLVLITLFPVAFGLYGWLARDEIHELWTSLLLAAVFFAVFSAIFWSYYRQRFVIDGRAVWIRYVRWVGPIWLHEVVAVQGYFTRYARGLVLVQPTVGRRLGFWSAVSSYGMLRRGPLRDLEDPGAGALRHIYLPTFTYHADVLRHIAAPLLHIQTIRLDAFSRRALGAAVNSERLP